MEFSLATYGLSIAAIILFGLGAGLPLLMLGFVSRKAMPRFRGRLMTEGVMGKKLLGGVSC